MTHIHRASRSHRRRHPWGAAVAAANWWNATGDITCCTQAYKPKGAASLAASYTDLTGNGNDAAVGIAPTWDAVNGWIFNGTTQHLTTAFVPQTDQSQSMIVQFTNYTSPTAARYLCGSDAGADRDFRLSANWWAVKVNYSNATDVNVAPNLAAGNLAVAGSQGYRNGVAEGAAIGAWTDTGIAVYIGCINEGGSPARYAAAYIQAFALYDCVLTAPQVSAVATAMAAL